MLGLHFKSHFSYLFVKTFQIQNRAINVLDAVYLPSIFFFPHLLEVSVVSAVCLFAFFSTLNYSVCLGGND